MPEKKEEKKKQNLERLKKNRWKGRTNRKKSIRRRKMW